MYAGWRLHLQCGKTTLSPPHVLMLPLVVYKGTLYTVPVTLYTLNEFSYQPAPDHPVYI